MARPWLNGLAALACVLAGVPVRGNPPEAQQREARAHYEEGLSRYNLGEFDAAIVEFKAAYTISHAPRLLFNIAQAQRLRKDYVQALYSYTTYLRLVPDAPNRVDVVARIAELSRLLTEKELPVEPPTPAVSPPPSPAPEVLAPPELPPSPAPVAVPAPTLERGPPADCRHARREIWAGVSLLVGGAVLVAAAAGCTANAASDGSQLSRLKSSGGAWSQQYQGVYDHGVLNQTAAAALWAVGGAVAVVGAVLAIVGGREDRRLRLEVGAASSGVSLSLSGRLP